MKRYLPGLVVIAVIAGLLLPAPGGAGTAAPRRPGTLVIETVRSGAGKEESAGAPVSILLRRAGVLDVRSISPEDLKPELLTWADVIVLDAGGDGLTEDRVESLLAAVRDGKGLVVCGDAARALPDSRGYATLLGRTPEKSGAAAVGEPKPLVVAVLDQKHPVTQCIPHFHHRGLAGYLTSPGTAVLASAGDPRGKSEDESPESPLRPVVWTHRHRGGAILVSALDYAGGPSRGLGALVVARACQWVAREPITLPVRGEYRLLSETAAGEEAAIPGHSRPGEYFRGRQIARFMTYHGARWLTREEREEEERPEEVLDSLAIRPGSTVVDLGAGNGYFTERLSARVGERGKVLAVDIQKEMLELLQKRVATRGLKNVELIHATETDPRLPESAVDLVLMVDVYHEISRPAPVLAAVRKSLKKDGRLVLVEYRGEDPTIAIKPLHRILLRQARAELEGLGYRFVESKEFLPVQRVIIFTKSLTR